LFGGLVAVLTGALGLYAVATRLTRPVRAEIGTAPRSLNAQSITFPSQFGSVIHGWLSRADDTRGAILLLPGIRANRLSMVKRAEFLRQAGYSTLLIDLQATGESGGEAITFGWREHFDVLAAVDYLRTRIPGQPVGIIGVSLGGAATLLATPPLRVQAVVLEAVYPSIDRAVVNRLSMRVGPLARMIGPLLLAQLPLRLAVNASELRPVDHIGRLECPVLIIAGTVDQHTTMADTQQLFDAAHDPKDLWLVPNAAHVDYLQFAGEGYRHRVLDFIASAFQRAAGT